MELWHTCDILWFSGARATHETRERLEYVVVEVGFTRVLTDLR